MPNITPAEEAGRILDTNFDIPEFLERIESAEKISVVTRNAARQLLSMKNPTTLRIILASRMWKVLQTAIDTDELADELMDYAAGLEMSERVLRLLKIQVGILSRRVSS